MKKIIIPVDFSLYSENALRTAASFAKKYNSELIVVHMLELSSAIASVPQSYVNEQAVFYAKLAEKQFNEFLDKDYLKDIKITPIIKHYKIFSELNTTAKEEEADLIVMGSHGVSGLKEIFVGSNTEKVVRTSKVPVLVVKGLPISGMFKKAVFGCNFTDNDIAPYKKAKKIFSGMGCKLTLLHVNTPYDKFLSTKERKEKVSKFLNSVEEDINLLDEVAYVSAHSVEEGITYYAKENNADVIVLATHGRRGLDHFFNGSISEDIANHSVLPVLTIKKES